MLRFKRKRAKTVEPDVDLNTRSPLFRIPAELRECIWEYTLTYPSSSDSLHFHVYDEVLDECTYKTCTMNGATSGKLHHKTALLRVSRAVYTEAVGFLYLRKHFDLVLMSGHPRGKINKEHFSRNLGKIHERAGLFKQIRQATIIVQPGRCPDISAYTKRIAKLLNALDYGNQINDLTIKFNFGFAHVTNLDRWAVPIVDMFAALESGMKQDHRRTIRIVACQGPERQWAAFRQALFKLSAHIGLSEGQLEEWDPMAELRNFAWYHMGDQCLLRGAFSKFSLEHPNGFHWSKRETVLWGAVTVLIFAIMPPLALALYAKRKRSKGESWKVFRC
ncbi:hypothetical protein M433DRAFT_158107 [Acidomyces richmondensis BFW]|nr:hypothetical protein M433DRAFT_158107 [Acidomyces richmondensis BFW]